MKNKTAPRVTNPINAFTRFFKGYVDFKSPAKRSEYWWWVLDQVIIYTVMVIAAGVLLGIGMSTSTTAEGSLYFFAIIGIIGLVVIWALATIVPNYALRWRRYTDTGLPGWLSLLPVILSAMANASNINVVTQQLNALRYGATNAALNTSVQRSDFTIIILALSAGASIFNFIVMLLNSNTFRNTNDNNDTE